jgi:uncharacterized NAD(P)/FAD-binding protein YdhS
MHVAIVGGGATGILTALCILHDAHANDCVTLYEPTPQIGTGVAYRTTDEALLLNVRALQMSAYADQPNHFVEWLTTHKNQSDGEAFVPRTWYAQYLRDTLATAIRHSHAHFTLIVATIIDIDPHNRTLRDSDGQQYTSDQVVLALGHAPIANPLARWVPTPQRMVSGYDWAAITTQISPLDDIIIIGSGLTMVDTIVALQHHGHRGNISAFSRHGHVPQTHVPRQSYPSFITSAHYGWSVADLLRLVRTPKSPGKPPASPGKLSSMHCDHTINNSGYTGHIPRNNASCVMCAPTGTFIAIALPPKSPQLLQVPHTSPSVLRGLSIIANAIRTVSLTIQHRHTHTTSTVTAAYVVNCTGSAQ